MDIFSKRDGPRPEDVKARRMIAENAGTIRRLADQFSNGGFTRMREGAAARAASAQPVGLSIHDLRPARAPDAPEPYLRISLNGRVVIADRASGRQLAYLGEIRGGAFTRRFVLATRENGFVTPVDDATRAAIGMLDQAALGPDFTEEDLADRLRCELSLPAG